VHGELDELWQFVLRRPIRPGELVAAHARLEAGSSYASILQELAGSEEYAQIKRLEDSVAWARLQRSAGLRPRNLEAPPGGDERLIEIPWCLARYAGEPRVLDAGYAFAEPIYLDGLADAGVEELVGVDLVTADVRGFRSVQADLRDLPFEDESFDVAIAISTIEHIGRDNTQYGLAAEDGDTLDAALRELRRIAPRVLVTVPTGERALLPEQSVYEPSEWVDRFTRAGFLVYEDELYELTPDGWRSVDELTPGTRHGERGPGASAVLCAELHHRTISERFRLAVRDRRNRDDVRRATA
jgi:hypothetical protein